MTNLAEIIGVVFAGIYLATFLVLCILWCISTIKTEIMKKDYKLTLNEHDLAVITKYEAIKWKFKNKKNYE